MPEADLAYLGLGSNLGNRLAFLRGGKRDLCAHPEIDLVSCSGVYETTAQGGPADSPDYLNAVLAVRTTLPPQQLLDLCLNIERDYGRSRPGRWQPRTLDIDLLLYGDRILTEETLQLPHPRMHQRGFVLIPLAEIAPLMLHPQRLATIADLAGQCPDPDAVRLLRSNW